MNVGNNVLYRRLFEHKVQYKQKSRTCDDINKHIFVKYMCFVCSRYGKFICFVRCSKIICFRLYLFLTYRVTPPHHYTG